MDNEYDITTIHAFFGVYRSSSAVFLCEAPTGEWLGRRDRGRERAGKTDIATLKESADTAKDDTEVAEKMYTTAKESARGKDGEKRGAGTQKGPRDMKSANGGGSKNWQMQPQQRKQRRDGMRGERIANGADLSKKPSEFTTTVESHPVTVGIGHTREHAPDPRTRKQS